MTNVAMCFKRRFAYPEETKVACALMNGRSNISISRYSLINSDNRRTIELPMRCTIHSLKDVSKLLSLFEQAHKVPSGKIVLDADCAVDDLHARTIQFCRPNTDLADFIIDVPLEEEIELVELLERADEKTVEARIDSILEPPFSVSLNVNRDTIWDDRHTLNVLGFTILLPLPEHASAKERLQTSIRSVFNVIEVQEENGQLAFYCSTDEGPYVHTIYCVKAIIEDFFGPDIVQHLGDLGIACSSIRFDVSCMYG